MSSFNSSNNNYNKKELLKCLIITILITQQILLSILSLQTLISQFLSRLRQIQGFEMVDNFKDAYGKTWKLVKRSTDNSVEIPDPQYLQVTDYWCHEVPGSNGKIFCYVVEGIKHPRDDGSQKMIVLYQWFSTTFNKSFTPQMISQPEWHKANVYSTDLIDSKLSKLYALCKTPQNEIQPEAKPEQKQEHIEDIDLNAILKL